MQTATVFLRFLFPLLVGGIMYALGAGPAWSMGLFLLTGSICFPLFGTAKTAAETKVSRLDFTCPEKLRRWIYPVILVCGSTVFFFSILQNSRAPDSWKNDRIQLDLHGEEETGYSKKVWRAKESATVFGNFTKESSVEADGIRLKRTMDHQEFLADPTGRYYDGITFIKVSPKYRQLKAVTPRKIVRKLANPYWLFTLLLALCL